jgi:putative copper export protein
VNSDVNTVVLFLHVLAVCVWVGGQIVLAGLVGVLRSISPNAPKMVAKQFNRIAWPAFGVAILTGVWNLTEIDVGDRSTGYQAALLVKLVLVALSGVAAFLHTQARTRAGTATWGALSGLSALGALLFGVILATSA